MVLTEVAILWLHDLIHHDLFLDISAILSKSTVSVKLKASQVYGTLAKMARNNQKQIMIISGHAIMQPQLKP